MERICVSGVIFRVFLLQFYFAGCLSVFQCCILNVGRFHFTFNLQCSNVRQVDDIRT